MIKASQIEYHDLSLQGSNLNIWAGKKNRWRAESHKKWRAESHKGFFKENPSLLTLTGVITHFSLI